MGSYEHLEAGNRELKQNKMLLFSWDAHHLLLVLTLVDTIQVHLLRFLSATKFLYDAGEVDPLLRCSEHLVF